MRERDRSDGGCEIGRGLTKSEAEAPSRQRFTTARPGGYAHTGAAGADPAWLPAAQMRKRKTSSFDDTT